MTNLIGWIGNLFFLIGAIYLAEKRRIGWHYQIMGNLCYVGVGILLDTNSLWGLSILLILVNLHGLYQWRTRKNG